MISIKYVWDMISLEKFTRRKPSIRHPKTFGCIAWAHALDIKRKRMDVKSHVCIMVGYFDEFKSYRLFDIIK
jgi:hypothetical protein